MKNKIVHNGIIAIFCSLYFLVATISMINSVAFFNLIHSGLMSWSLAIGFELGAAASLGAIIILEKTNRAMVWGLFLLLTSFQMMANSFHAYVNLEDYMGWIELFGLQEEDPLFQKRILSIISGAVLPLVALGFIKSLVDYIRPSDEYSKKDIQKIIEANENAPEPNDKLKKAAEEYFEDGNVPREKEDDTDEWDEDHALDMVMNQMVEDLQLDENDDLLNNSDDDSTEEIIVPPLEVKSAEAEERKAKRVKAPTSQEAGEANRINIRKKQSDISAPKPRPRN